MYTILYNINCRIGKKTNPISISKSVKNRRHYSVVVIVVEHTDSTVFKKCNAWVRLSALMKNANTRVVHFYNSFSNTAAFSKMY